MGKVENYKHVSSDKAGQCCPECKISWDGGDILEHFLEAKFNPSHKQHDYYADRTLAQIREAAGSYGWTQKTPRRFGSDNIQGVDLSMDPDAKGDDQYDGVSYWQCLGCGVAWHRFKGTRTEKFVGKMGHVLPVVEKPERQCIYRSLTTPDGTVLVSEHNHDYVIHEDKNGETYMIDGGPSKYYRTNVNKVEGIITEVYADEPHKKIRKYLKRGGRGKDGKQPLTWVPVCEMNDEWVKATITYNEDRGMGDGWFNKVLKKELKYRKKNKISIEE